MHELLFKRRLFSAPFSSSLLRHRIKLNARRRNTLLKTYLDRGMIRLASVLTLTTGQANRETLLVTFLSER